MFVTQLSHKNGCDVIYDPEKPLEYESGQTIFVHSNDIPSFFKLTLDKPCTIVTAVGDRSPSTFFSDDDIGRILENKHIFEWRAQNACTIHPKMKHLSIGLEDTQSKLDFCRDHMDELMAIPKKDEIYSCFAECTNPTERMCFPSDQGPKMGFEDYMRNMARYKYVLCPMGNGLDTHRFWEAQVCGCIPVIRCPKEFLPTYEGFPYISLPGWCATRFGQVERVEPRVSIFKINTSNEDIRSPLQKAYRTKDFC